MLRLRLMRNCLLAGLLAAMAESMSTDLGELWISGDIHQRLPATGGGTVTASDDSLVAFDVAAGTAAAADLIGPFDRSDVDAFHRGVDGCGPSLFSLDTVAEVNGVPRRPADVFQSNGTPVLDADAAGVGPGINVDAVSRVPGACTLVISVDVIAELGGTVYRPDDLIAWDGAAFSLFSTGNSGGNVDALHLLSNGNVLLSFSDMPPGLGQPFSDDQVIEWDRAGGYQLAFSPADFDDSWSAADLDALWAAALIQNGGGLIFADSFE